VLWKIKQCTLFFSPGYSLDSRKKTYFYCDLLVSEDNTNKLQVLVYFNKLIYLFSFDHANTVFSSLEISFLARVLFDICILRFTNYRDSHSCLLALMAIRQTPCHFSSSRVLLFCFMVCSEPRMLLCKNRIFCFLKLFQ